jgi:putative flippase GtrA
MSLRRNSPDLSEFIRYATVGAVQNGLNLCVFALAVAGGVPYLIASVLAAAIALSVSFALNRRWTFRGRTDQTTGRAIRFVAIWIVIVLLALPVLAVLVDVVHLPQVVAQAIVVLIGAPASYAAQRRWTFSGGYSQSDAAREHSRKRPL